MATSLVRFCPSRLFPQLPPCSRHTSLTSQACFWSSVSPATRPSPSTPPSPEEHRETQPVPSAPSTGPLPRQPSDGMRGIESRPLLSGQLQRQPHPKDHLRKPRQRKNLGSPRTKQASRIPRPTATEASGSKQRGRGAMSILETPEAAGTDSGGRPVSPPARAHVDFIMLPASCRPGGLGEEEPPEARCPGGNSPPPAMRPASTNHAFPLSTW